MVKVRKRQFDWVVAAAVLFGAAVIAPSMIALAATLFAVAQGLF